MMMEFVTDEYGTRELNPMRKGYHDEEAEEIFWEELKEIKKPIVAERFRFLTDRGYPYYDLSYLHVRIEGKRYRVLATPFEQIQKNQYRKRIYNIVKKEGIFIKNLFDVISYLD